MGRDRTTRTCERIDFAQELLLGGAEDAQAKQQLVAKFNVTEGKARHYLRLARKEIAPLKAESIMYRRAWHLAFRRRLLRAIFADTESTKKERAMAALQVAESMARIEGLSSERVIGLFLHTSSGDPRLNSMVTELYNRMINTPLPLQNKQHPVDAIFTSDDDMPSKATPSAALSETYAATPNPALSDAALPETCVPTPASCAMQPEIQEKKQEGGGEGEK